ncbi:transcriptional regulator ovo-like [Bactrocera dorsalis]|uniref:Transcriptional regulator ovo-like n=1 Tax=Bactrocera dorsalis TaxID=27457 RepID=A0ABM3JMS2_BACDO|nr:transcriptional regulator ovo-like [Bactrocera dorsalis]
MQEEEEETANGRYVELRRGEKGAALCKALLKGDRASCSTNITDRRPSDIMANGDCYRRLSNSSSALYGSCPQLTQHCDLIQQHQQQQQQQPHCPHISASEQVAQQAKQHYQSTHQQTRQYSSLVRTRPSRSPVLSRTTKHSAKAAKEASAVDASTAAATSTTTTAKNASAAKSTSLAFVSYKPTALIPKINRAQQLQQEFTSSIATPAVTATRYLCQRCRYNNQPITWWVSCPRLSNLGSTLSLQQSATAATELQLQQQTKTPAQPAQAIPQARVAGSNYDYQQQQQHQQQPAHAK